MSLISNITGINVVHIKILLKFSIIYAVIYFGSEWHICIGSVILQNFIHAKDLGFAEIAITH